MRIALLDLGVGNLHSLEKAFARAVPGSSIEIATSVPEALGHDLLVLPGVGSWGAIRWGDDREVLRRALEGGAPCIGICLGMQILFESSEEAAGPGIGLFAGPVTRLRSPRAPHMGFSLLVKTEAGADLEHVPRAAYFAHSYACRPVDESVALVRAEVDGDAFAAVVRSARTIGCQFHPEKSSDEGIAFLAEIVAKVREGT